MTDKQGYLMKLIAYEMSVLRRKADLEDKGFTDTQEYDAVCEDLQFLDKMIDHIRFVYDTATRRYDKLWKGEGEF